jgi:hypothetical protein
MSECWCHHCHQGEIVYGWMAYSSSRMILCPTCGNKRCPHATHHEHPCTGSNDAGQHGSVYGDFQITSGGVK